MFQDVSWRFQAESAQLLAQWCARSCALGYRRRYMGVVANREAKSGEQVRKKLRIKASCHHFENRTPPEKWSFHRRFLPLPHWHAHLQLSDSPNPEPSRRPSRTGPRVKKRLINETPPSAILPAFRSGTRNHCEELDVAPTHFGELCGDYRHHVADGRRLLFATVED